MKGLLVILGICSAGLTAIAQLDGTKKWEFYGGGEFRSSPVIGADGTIYIGTTTSAGGVGSTKRFYAINPDGTEKWWFESRPFGFPVGFETSPCLWTNGMVVVSAGKRMHILNPEDGTEWFHYFHDFDFYGPAIAKDGRILVAVKSIFALDPNDSDNFWGYGNGGEDFMMTPSVGTDGTVYVANGYEDGYRVTALTAKGTEKWFHYGQGVDDMKGCTIAIGADHSIYFGTKFGRVTALNRDGTVRWTRLFENNFNYRARPVIGPSGRVYIKVHDRLPITTASLVALDPTDGSTVFSESSINDSFHSVSPAINDTGAVYVASGNRLSALHHGVGFTYWDFSTFRSRGFWGSCPAIADDGTVYVGSLDNYLYAVHGQGGTFGILDGTPWPREGANNRGTGQAFAPSFEVRTGPTGRPELDIKGWKGLLYRVETSTNLADWTHAGTRSATNMVTTWLGIERITNFNSLFYRVSIP